MPQGDLGLNPACKRHAFSRTQPSLTDRPVGPLDARVSPGWFDRALGRRGDDIGQAPLRELPHTAKAQYEEDRRHGRAGDRRSEEHTSELQSLMRISYAVFCLKKKNR